MAISSKLKLFVFILFVSGSSASAQSLMLLIRSQQNDAVESKWEINSVNNAQELNYYNNDYCDYYLARTNDNSYELRPGKNTVFSIKEGEPLNNPFQSPGSYRYYPGRFPRKFDKSFPYALPVKHGKETAWKRDRRESCMTLNFSVPKGDTIYATRSGVVCKAGNERQVLVYHDDCTFAAYLMLERKFVYPKDEIRTGDPVGVASSEGVSLSFYYLDENKFRSGGEAFDYYYSHYVPVFRTAEGDVKPEEGKKYRAVTDDALITQEMSKREKKRYLKNQK